MKVITGIHKISLFVLAAVLTFSLTACSKKGSSGGNVQQSSQAQNPPQEVTLPPLEDDSDDDDGLISPDELDFGLGDTDTLTAPANQGLYTIEDGVAYALDPTTLEKTGPALDPITHEPLDSLPSSDPFGDTSESPTQDNVQSTPVENDVPTPDITPVETPSESTKPEVTPDTSLPNTGIFLEDD